MWDTSRVYPAMGWPPKPARVLAVRCGAETRESRETEAPRSDVATPGFFPPSCGIFSKRSSSSFTGNLQPPELPGQRGGRPAPGSTQLPVAPPKRPSSGTQSYPRPRALSTQPLTSSPCSGPGSSQGCSWIPGRGIRFSRTAGDDAACGPVIARYDVRSSRCGKRSSRPKAQATAAGLHRRPYRNPRVQTTREDCRVRSLGVTQATVSRQHLPSTRISSMHNAFRRPPSARRPGRGWGTADRRLPPSQPMPGVVHENSSVS